MANNQVSYGNETILKSIPINSGLKSFLWKKFQWLAEHNGVRYASSLFQEMKEVVMAYVADPKRTENRQGYVSALPIRNRAVCNSLLGYADTQPHTVVDLLKVYTSVSEPVVSVEESSDDLYERLGAEYPDPESLKALWRRMFSEYPVCSFKVFRKVYRKWQKWILKELDHRMVSIKWPTPAEYTSHPDAQSAWEVDMFTFFQQADEWGIELSEYLHDQGHVRLYRGSLGHNEGYEESVVGVVHHIPKKGTVKRRPIADPNKWWQALSEPYAAALYAVLEKYARKTDCTFNQCKFVQELQDRLNRGEYIGSVDLSAATDYLPMAWCPANLGHLLGEEHKLFDSELASLVLARSWYLDDAGGAVRWKQGQPLGSKASFALLGITHNFILDLLSTALGLSEHPYRVVGDDVIILTPELRSTYIRFMEANGIPLSLHKSYEYRAAEFAGRWFVVNQPPSFISDHNVIRYNNLFDYSRATGVVIRWEHLPKAVQAKWCRGFRSTHQAMKAYDIVAHLEAGDPQIAVRYPELCARYYQEVYSNEKTLVDGTDQQVWITLDGHSFLTGSSNAQRLQTLKEWKKRKFRPSSTNHLRKSILTAMDG